MPQRTKKEHKCSHHTARGSRWHDFHFSGKVIVCSVILGFMLILIGGILMAIGMDRDEDTKSDKYEDLQKKPPMVYVGPTIMGIGGFAVIVGVLMCLIETKVCRKRNPDASPLINGEGEQTEVKSSDDSVRESDPTAVPSTSSHHHRNGGHKKSPSPRKSKSKKSHSSNHRNQTKPTAQLSPSSDQGGNSSKNFLTASDKFLTPPDSFVDDVPGMEQLREKENQVTSSLMQSFNSSGKSWNASNEFQTPSASFIDDPLTLQFMDKKEEQNVSHKFVTPQNSDAGIIDEKQVQIHRGKGYKNEVTTSEENVPEKAKSLEVSVPVHTAEDGGQTIAQGSSDVILNKESITTAEVEPMAQNQAHDNLGFNHIPETKEEALLNEGTHSSAASHEGNENHVKEDAHSSDVQANASIEENAHDNNMDESSIGNSDVHTIEISEPETAEISHNDTEEVSTYDEAAESIDIEDTQD